MTLLQGLSQNASLVLFASLLRLGDQLLSQSDIHVLDKPSLAIGLVVFGLRWLAMCHISHISLMLLGSHRLFGGADHG